MANVLSVAAWIVASSLSAELLGYGLHRLLHSGRVGFLSRNHMKHHLVLYGPLQPQRSSDYRDATGNSVSLGNIGMEWLIPAAVLIACALELFHLLRVRPLHQLIYFGITLGWSFLMFSWLHDVQHIEGFWMEKNRVLRGWFVAARRRHELHHCSIADDGLMNKNFGIGFFLFDRVFGTFSETATAFNQNGYQAARERFQSMLGEMLRGGHEVDTAEQLACHFLRGTRTGHGGHCDNRDQAAQRPRSPEEGVPVPECRVNSR